MQYNDYIFVYGTLRSDLPPTTTNPQNSPMQKLLNKHCQYIAQGYAVGELYLVAHYPGFINTNSQQNKSCVHGQLYAFNTKNTELLTQLDEYEECAEHFAKPHLYVRKKLNVQLNNNQQISAWVYIYNRDISQLMRINSGDYCQYLQQKKC